METLDPELKEFLEKRGGEKLRKTCSDYAKDEQLLTNVENEIFLIMIGVEYVGNLILYLKTLVFQNSSGTTFRSWLRKCSL